MRSYVTNSFILGVLVVLPLFFLWGCENDTSNGPADLAGDKTCLACHSSEERLVASLGEESRGEVVTALKDDG